MCFLTMGPFTSLRLLSSPLAVTIAGVPVFCPDRQLGAQARQTVPAGLDTRHILLSPDTFQVLKIQSKKQDLGRHRHLIHQPLCLPELRREDV